MLEINSLERDSSLCLNLWQLDHILRNNYEEMKLYLLFTE